MARRSGVQTTSSGYGQSSVSALKKAGPPSSVKQSSLKQASRQQYGTTASSVEKKFNIANPKRTNLGTSNYKSSNPKAELPTDAFSRTMVKKRGASNSREPHQGWQPVTRPSVDEDEEHTELSGNPFL